MKIYLVGGAVRDPLLGLTPRERDYCVVGATPDEMLKQGFQQVGRDFPVFLHPDTKEEYALARTERKTASGHQGFSVMFDATVTLEDDLKRRDLTINAIAQDTDGALIDPYGGKQDLEAKILRHVSEAFSEDPLRVLRLARFGAKFHKQGFVIAQATLTLVQSMVASGELTHLSRERFALETSKAMLGEDDAPAVYVTYLQQWGVLSQWLGCAITDEMVETAKQVLLSVAHKTTDPWLRWTGFLLGLLRHQNNDFASCAKQSVLPSYETALGVLIGREHARLFHPHQYTPKETLDALYAIDAFRRPERIGPLFWIVRALWDVDHPNEIFPNHDETLFWALDALKSCKVEVDTLPPDARGKAVFDARLAVLNAVMP